MKSLIFIIPILYAVIHMLEFMSYFSRIAGLITGYKLVSYSVQQMFFVITRFFFTALMPIMGFLVDNKIENHVFLKMIHGSLFIASILYVVVFLCRKYIIFFVIKIMQRRKKNIVIDNLYDIKVNFSISTIVKYKKTISYSIIVFLCYGLGVFIAFYFSAIFYEYRVTISQLSGLINGLATLLLTFIIEPKLAEVFDESDKNAIQILYAVLLGRFIAIAIFSHLVLIILSILTA